MKLRNAVRFFYDVQTLRIQGGNRGNRAVKTSLLDDHDKAFMERMSGGLEKLEKETLAEIRLHLRGIPISGWLLAQKGLGPTLAGVIVSEVDIERSPTVSALWKYAGLAVSDGHADRRRKGVKSNWNPFLKAKLLKVLGECLIKSNSPWRKFYDDYKWRKLHTEVPTCMACEGTGKMRAENADEDRELKASHGALEDRERRASRDADEDQSGAASHMNPETRAIRAGRSPTGNRTSRAGRDAEEDRSGEAGPGLLSRQQVEERRPRRAAECSNCGGTGGPAPWGRSDAHRHAAAVRYMVKMLLAQLWEEWRRMEGLPVRPLYAEEYLGRSHHERQEAHRFCTECGTKVMREAATPAEWRSVLTTGVCVRCAREHSARPDPTGGTRST